MHRTAVIPTQKRYLLTNVFKDDFRRRLQRLILNAVGLIPRIADPFLKQEHGTALAAEPVQQDDLLGGIMFVRGGTAPDH